MECGSSESGYGEEEGRGPGLCVGGGSWKGGKGKEVVRWRNSVFFKALEQREERHK